MDKVRIVNWLLTRKCNLRCEYCAITKDYISKPKEYPHMNHYIKNEMSTIDVIKGLERFNKHNPECFHIFYGGEPLLRKDLSEIISYCNFNNIYYTIISNNTKEVSPMILDLYKKTDGGIKGFTASVDPVNPDEGNTDRYRKSVEGFKNLVKLKNYTPDVVAEITVMKDNLRGLIPLVRRLTQHQINSDITFIDIAKNNYYDFSNISDENQLVHRDSKLSEIFQQLMDCDFDIHMKEILIPAIWDILPSDMDCEIDKSVHNISVDADGSIRLCLRIRGVHTPTSFYLNNMFDSNFELKEELKIAIGEDKQEYCQLCNHTCQLMSWHIDKTDSDSDDLVHSDRRK